MRFFNGILKWMAMLAFSISAGLMVIIFLSGQPQISAFLLRILILLAIGFIGSLFTRFLFRKGFALLLVLVTWITSIIAILLIDNFYESEYTLSFLSETFQFAVPSISDTAQIILLLIISFPSILLFRKKKHKSQKTTKQKPVGQSLSDQIKVAVYQVNPKNWNIKLPNFSKPFTTTNSSNKSATKVQISPPSNGRVKSSPTVKTPKRVQTYKKKIKLPSFKKRHTNNDVKLMGEEEHVCPYCLEEVIKNDGHGVSVCSECGTWHHKDCWDVTGSCGVAHRNQL